MGSGPPCGLLPLNQLSGVAGTVNFEHIKRNHYESHRGVNPTGIVPLGPVLDFSAPHVSRAAWASDTPVLA
jgi:glutathionyl-hydroquinone reductase